MEIKNSAWPHREDVVILINPAKRNRIKKTVVVFGVISLTLLALIDGRGPLMEWAKQKSHIDEREKLAPIMQKLANEGNSDAIIWRAKNYPETKSEKLEALVASGNSQAMMVLAAQKWNAKDFDGAKQLILTAAEKGNEEAIKVRLSLPDLFN